MTATERLRELLDERGVEWGASDTYRLLVTSWSDSSGHSWAFAEHRDGSFSKLTAYHLTPEQAVEATLGRGTCEVVSSTLHEYEGGYAGSEWEHELSCGHAVWWASGDAPEWCPWCGAKVVDA